MLAPSRSPENVTAVANGTEVIQVNWVPVDPQFLHGTLHGYKVRFKEHAQLNVADWIVKTVNSTTQRVELTGLKAQTEYEVQVLAFTIKDGNYSKSVIVMTERGRKFNKTSAVYELNSIHFLDSQCLTVPFSTLEYRAFSLDVTAAMLVFPSKGISLSL